MKNADRVAKIIVDTVGPPPEMDRILAAQFYVAIKDALEDAYQKGAEDMRIAAAKVAEKRIVHNARLDYDAGWNRGANLIEDEIRHLPLHPEGGGR